MSKLKFIFLLMLSGVLLNSCCEECPEKNEIIDIQVSDITVEAVEEEVEPEVVEKEYSLNIIDNEVHFSNLEKVEVTTDKFAIVGSDQALLFPIVELKKDSDIEKLVDGVPIEIGTIISIEDTVQIEDTIHDNFFRYEGDNNYFYKTTINDISYLIWGADLIINIKQLETIDKISYYYKKDIKSDKFLPFNGERELTDKNISDIEESRVSFESINGSEDLFTLYRKDAETLDNTLFITTDLLLKSVQLYFNKLSTFAVYDTGLPKLLEFVDLFLEDLERYEADDNMKNQKYSEALLDTKNYLLMAKIILSNTDDGEMVNELLSTMPQFVVDEYQATTDYDVFNWFSQRNITPRVALTISHVSNENKKLLELWNTISGSLNYFTTYAMFSLFETKEIYNFPYWLEDDNNIYSNEGYAMWSTLFKADDSQTELTGLDFMASLGSKSALSLINQLEENSEELEDFLPSLGKNYNTSYLALLKTVATFEQSEDFYFAEKGKWNQKVLNTALGALTELRFGSSKAIDHDYLELGGEVETGTTSRVIPYLRPIHYVEPNIEFFRSLNILLAELKDKIDDEKIDDFEEISLNLTEIVEAEIANTLITDEQNEYIAIVPTLLSRLVSLHELNMPITLEDEVNTGSGIPNRMFVALNDNQGGKRIATGYTYSYFEENGLPFWAEDSIK